MAAEKKSIDWEAVEREYRAGLRSLADIGWQFDVSAPGIVKKAKKEGWSRDLSAKIKAKAEAKVLVLKPLVDKSAKHGFVYVVYVEDLSGERFYKIGMDSSFPARAKAHQCSSPFDVCVSCAYFVENMRQEERLLHSIFEGQRVRGEWFKLSDSDLNNIAMRSRLA